MVVVGPGVEKLQDSGVAAVLENRKANGARAEAAEGRQRIRLWILTDSEHREADVSFS